MAVGSRARVRLVLRQLTFVSAGSDFEGGPNEHALLVDQEVLRRMVTWAELLGWRNPDRSLLVRHVPRPAVPALVATLRAALATEPSAPAGPRGRASTEGAMREFFSVARNLRQLSQTLDFLEAGGELVVEAL